MIVAMAQPFLLTMKFVCQNTNGKWAKFKGTLFGIFGYVSDAGDTPEEIQRKFNIIQSYFLSQNAAMFALQMINSFLIGQSFGPL